MTAPGWYNAEGDPPGTQRYWDGSQWVGEPTPVATQPAAPQGFATASPSAPSGGGYGYDAGPRKVFPGSLKSLAIVVSVLKGLGWILVLISMIYLATFLDDANDFDNAFGGNIDLGGALTFVLGLFAVLLIAGGTLLFFHMRAANREDASTLFTVSLIMTILDGIAAFLMFLGWNSARNDPFTDEGGSLIIALVYLAMFVLQLMITMQAKKAS